MVTGGTGSRGEMWQRVNRLLMLATATYLAPNAVAAAASLPEVGDATFLIVQADRTYAFDISAQPLPQAIADFSAITGLQVLYTQDEPFGKTSPAISGSYTPEQALQVMLAGSGLTYRFAGPDVVTLELAPVREESGPLQLDAIAVIGDKLGRSAEDIPSGVTIFDRFLLDTATSTEANEAFERAANVTIGEPANGSIQIRGVNNNNVVRNTDTGSNASITTFVNQAPVTFSYFDYLTPSLWDMETVEIFKGPQSVTQGPNALAGAVFFNYREPEFNLDGEARTSYATAHTGNLAVAQNVPVVDEVLGFRVSYERRTTDGFISNDTLGIDDWAAYERDSVRLQSLLQPNGSDDIRMKVTLTADWAEGVTAPNHGGFSSFFDRINSHDVRDEDEIRGITASAEISARVSDSWTLTSITSWNGLDAEQFFDGDSAPTAGGAIDFFRDEDVYTQEFRGNIETGRWRGVIGAFGQSGRYDSGFDFIFAGLGVGFVKSLEDERLSAALFGSAEYDLTDRLTLGAGLRFNHERYEVEMGQILSPLGGPDGSDSIDQQDTDLLPSASLRYRLSDDLEAGALVSRGYRSGGGSVTYSPQFVAAEVLGYRPEYAWNYEAYWRSSWLGERLTLDGNIFFVDWQDMQVAVPSPGALNTTDTFTTNAASSEMYGAELQAIYRVDPFLSLDARIGYVNTEFKDFSFDATTDFSGQEFPNAAAVNFSIGADYFHDTGFFAAGRFTYASESYAQIQNHVATAMSSRELLSAKLGYDFGVGQVFVFGSNLLDDDYETLLFDAGAPRLLGSSGDPRIVGVGLTARW